MKRDMDLIRQILLAVEDRQETEIPFFVEVAGYSDEQMSYHIRILGEAGLLKAVELGRWEAQSLTWAGHDWIDATRNDSTWHKVKATARDRGVSLTFELTKQLAIHIAKSQLGLG